MLTAATAGHDDDNDQSLTPQPLPLQLCQSTLLAQLQQHDGFLLLSSEDFKLGEPTLVPSAQAHAAEQPTTRASKTKRAHRTQTAITTPLVPTKPQGSVRASSRHMGSPTPWELLRAKAVQEARHIQRSPALASIGVLLTAWFCSLVLFCCSRPRAAPQSARTGRHGDEDVALSSATGVCLEAALEAEMQQAAKWLSTEYTSEPSANSAEYRALLKGKGRGTLVAQGGWNATAHRQ